MTADRTDDILSLLDEVHGDGLTRREATVNDAVGQIERGAYRGYSALRDLAQRGTPRPATQAAALTGALPPAAEVPASAEVTAMIAAPLPPEAPALAETAQASDPSDAETRISAPPPKPEKPRIPEPVDVISGDGATFRERGHTQTHIIRRPKNWFGRR